MPLDGPENQVLSMMSGNSVQIPQASMDSKRKEAQAKRKRGRARKEGPESYRNDVQAKHASSVVSFADSSSMARGSNDSVCFLCQSISIAYQNSFIADEARTCR